MQNKRFISLLMVITGNILYALAVKLFILPAGLISCGTTGIALVMNHLFSIPLSEFILVFNIGMLAVGWWMLGRAFAMTTVLSSLFYPIALEVLNRVLGDVSITENILLNVFFGGMGLGISLGIVLRAGASTGGMDIPPLVLKKLFHIPVSASLWVFDFCIMVAQMGYHRAEDLLYGILLIMTISFALNKILLLGTSKTEVKIISYRSEEIRDTILRRLDRGVTMLHAEGGYRRDDRQVVLSVVSNQELPRVQQAAREIDPDCFMIVTRVTEVWGRGFSYGKHWERDEQKQSGQ